MLATSFGIGCFSNDQPTDESAIDRPINGGPSSTVPTLLASANSEPKEAPPTVYVMHASAHDHVSVEVDKDDKGTPILRIHNDSSSQNLTNVRIKTPTGVTLDSVTTQIEKTTTPASIAKTKLGHTLLLEPILPNGSAEATLQPPASVQVQAQNVLDVNAPQLSWKSPEWGEQWDHNPAKYTSVEKLRPHIETSAAVKSIQVFEGDLKKIGTDREVVLVDDSVETSLLIPAWVWPSLEGKTRESARRTIEQTNPYVTVFFVEKGSPVTKDLRVDRVRVFYDDSNNVFGVPEVG